MSRPLLLGNLPVIKDGPNKGRLDRPAACLLLGITKEEVSKAYNNWIQIFRMKGSSLTLEQYFGKLKESGISILQVGNSSDQYHLSRYGDIGPYTLESCRFILKVDNLKEQKKVSPYNHMVAKYGVDGTKEILRQKAIKWWQNHRGR